MTRLTWCDSQLYEKIYVTFTDEKENRPVLFLLFQSEEREIFKSNKKYIKSQSFPLVQEQKCVYA